MSHVIMSVDISTRRTGWAVCDVRSNKPDYGLWLLPGMASLGRLYGTFRNGLEAAFDEYKPARLVFAPALYSEAQTAARALGGMMAIAELAAHDMGVHAYEIPETTARKHVLGRGSFVVRDDKGRTLKGAGTKLVKAMAMDWCRNHGWKPQSDDVADALVLLEYARRNVLARIQSGELAA